MDFQHRMMRAAASAAMEKALRDIPRDARRTIRNLVDLGDTCARGEQQKRFLAQIHRVLSSPASPYYRLLETLVAKVDPARLRAIGVNLGCSSLSYGVGVLRRQSAALGFALPWLLIFETPISPVSPLIAQANDLGCYAFLFRNALPAPVCAVARRHEESTFFAAFSSNDLDAKSVQIISQTPNLLVAVDAAAPLAECARAFELLRSSRCLFGFHVAVADEETFSARTSLAFRREMLKSGCFFGSYEGQGACAKLRERLYRFICETRIANKGDPLLLLDFFRDTRYVAERILPGSFVPVIDPTRPLREQLVP